MIIAVKNWLRRVVIEQKLNNLFGYILLLSISSMMAFFIASFGVEIGIATLIFFAGILMVLLSFLSIKFGILLIIISSSFTFIVNRIIEMNLPFGVVFDLILLIIIIGHFMIRSEKKSDFLSNPFFVLYSFWILYTLIQVFNPNSTSIDGWLRGFRFLISAILTYVIYDHVFTDRRFLILFTKVWVSVAFLAASYGLFQEFFGLPFFDLRWVTKTEIRFGLNWIDGRWRKWSFMADSSIFGIFMAASSVFCLIMSQGKYKFAKKMVLVFMSVLMLIAMVFSGTRTAYIVVPVGLSIYSLISIDSLKTRILIIISVFSLLFVLYAPIYNPMFHRIRTAFNPTEDASYNVREVNRAYIQPYIYSHPMGGGINTVGASGKEFSPSHELAGFPPDSLFLSIALEYGWIGLILFELITLVVIVQGIINYFKAHDPTIKALYAAYISFYFALIVAGFAQDALFSFPVNYIFMAINVLMYKMILLQDDQFKNSTSSQGVNGK